MNNNKTPITAQAERARLLELANKRAAHEASAARHYARSWQAAYDYYMARHEAIRELIDVLKDNS